MNDPEKPIDSRILVDAIAEAKEMGRDGMAHPSTRPVLAGAGVGAVIGWILPLDTFGIVVGLLGGASYMLYKRIRP